MSIDDRLERSTSGRSRHDGRVAEYLHKNTNLDSTAHALERLRQGIVTAPQEDATPDSKKQEVFALLAYLLEDMYSRYGRPALYAEDGTPNVVFPETAPGTRTMRLRDVQALMEKSPLAGLACVRNAFYRAMQDVVDSWMSAVQAGPTTSTSESMPSMAFARLEALLRPADSPRSMLLRGAGTASHTAWDIIRAIPVVFHRATGGFVPEDEFRALVRSGERLALQLSSMHLRSFVRLKEYAANTTQFRPLDVDFGPEFFRLERRAGGEASLSLNEELVAAWSSTFTSPFGTGRYGCPARDARVEGTGGAKKSVLGEMYAYTAAVAETCLRPHLERFTEEMLALRSRA